MDGKSRFADRLRVREPGHHRSSSDYPPDRDSGTLVATPLRADRSGVPADGDVEGANVGMTRLGGTAHASRLPAHRGVTKKRRDRANGMRAGEVARDSCDES